MVVVVFRFDDSGRWQTITILPKANFLKVVKE